MPVSLTVLGGWSLFVVVVVVVFAVRGSVNMPVPLFWLELGDRERGWGPSFFSKKIPGCGFPPRLV